MIRWLLLALLALTLGCLPPEPIEGPMPNPNEKPEDKPAEKPTEKPNPEEDPKPEPDPNPDPDPDEDTEGKGQIECTLRCANLPDQATGALIGIQIDMLCDGNYQPYAYGLFEEQTLPTIDLKQDETYRIVASWVRQGDWLGKDPYGVQAPFCKPNGTGIAPGTQFVYSTDIWMDKLTLGGAYVTLPGPAGQRKWYNRPPLDRYSAAMEGLEVDQDAAVELQFERVSFEVRFEADWLEEGKIEIEQERDGKWTLEPGERSLLAVSTLQGVSGVSDWLKDDYTEKLDYSARWTRESGERINLGKKSFVVSGGSQELWQLPSPL